MILGNQLLDTSHFKTRNTIYYIKYILKFISTQHLKMIFALLHLYYNCSHCTHCKTLKTILKSYLLRVYLQFVQKMRGGFSWTISVAIWIRFLHYLSARFNVRYLGGCLAFDEIHCHGVHLVILFFEVDEILWNMREN